MPHIVCRTLPASVLIVSLAACGGGGGEGVESPAFAARSSAGADVVAVRAWGSEHHVGSVAEPSDANSTIADDSLPFAKRACDDGSCDLNESRDAPMAYTVPYDDQMPMGGNSSAALASDFVATEPDRYAGFDGAVAGGWKESDAIVQ